MGKGGKRRGEAGGGRRDHKEEGGRGRDGEVEGRGRREGGMGRGQDFGILLLTALTPWEGVKAFQRVDRSGVNEVD